MKAVFIADEKQNSFSKWVKMSHDPSVDISREQGISLPADSIADLSRLLGIPSTFCPSNGFRVACAIGH
jgi:hypothetical protein